MELLRRSLSLTSIASLLSRRKMLIGVGVLAATTGDVPLAHAQKVPKNLKHSNPDGMAKPNGYSHVVAMTGPGRTIYLAGQLGYDVNGKRAEESGDF